MACAIMLGGLAGAAYEGEVPLEGDDCRVWEYDVVCVSEMCGLGFGGGDEMSRPRDRGPAGVWMTMEWWASKL